MASKSDRSRSYKTTGGNRLAKSVGKRGKNRSARYPRAQGR